MPAGRCCGAQYGQRFCRFPRRVNDMKDRPESGHDVVIMGGGLSGLTLALQLRARMPDLRVLVLERRRHPVPLAAFKVGESSVEIGAHYFEHVLGLGEHLKNQQLKKFGFRFFFSEGRSDLYGVTELGASRPLPVPSYQIDRGVFENFLGQECLRRGVQFVDGASVREVVLSESGESHQIRWEDAAGGTHLATAPWVVDASGRVGIIKRQRGLALENNHKAHAVWFRIGERIDIDQWYAAEPAAEAWRARCETPTRWMSTNHLVGEGYWVWLIPLVSGSHSVGIVADSRYHPLESMNNFEKAMEWIQKCQPALYADLDSKRSKLQDFAFFRRFSYDCSQVLSANRWALTGEAGRFLDPFYSPGSDFIAIGNTYITELVSRDRVGMRLDAHAHIYEQILRSFYDSTLAIYVDQYGLFGDPEVLPCKVIWDYTYYWGILAQLFCQNRLTDLDSLSALRDELRECQVLNLAVQEILRDWGKVSWKRNLPVMLDQAQVPWFAELNRSLSDDLTVEQFRTRIRESTERLHQLASEILRRAALTDERLNSSALAECLMKSQRTHGKPESDQLLFPSPDAL
jgi:flavin-dependent dehydrogenase